MTSTYDFAYDSAYGMFIKKKTEILRMTSAYGSVYDLRVCLQQLAVAIDQRYLRNAHPTQPRGGKALPSLKESNQSHQQVVVANIEHLQFSNFENWRIPNFQTFTKIII